MSIATSFTVNASWWTAVLTAILALAGVAGVFVSLRAAAASKKSAEAALAQVRVSYPELSLVTNRVSSDTAVATGTIKYIAGTLPAQDVQVWIRGPSHSYRADIPFLGPTNAEVGFEAHPSSDAASSTFAKFPAPATATAANEAWVGVAWLAPDGTRKRWGLKTVDAVPVGPVLRD